MQYREFIFYVGKYDQAITKEHYQNQRTSKPQLSAKYNLLVIVCFVSGSNVKIITKQYVRQSMLIVLIRLW